MASLRTFHRSWQTLTGRMLGRRQAAPLTQCTHASYGLPPVVPAPQCIRINARPAGQTVLGYLTSDFIRDAPGSAAFLATAVGKTVLNGNLASGATRAVGAYAAGSPQKVVNEAGMLVQLLAAINKQVMPGEGDADIWPGRRHKLPFSELEWATGMIRPLVGDHATVSDEGGGSAGGCRGPWDSCPHR